MNNIIQIIDREELSRCIREEVDDAFNRAIPKLSRRINSKEYLTNDELAELTGWSKRSLANRRKSGQLPYIKRGRKVLYKAEEVYAWLEMGAVKRTSWDNQ